MQCNRISYCRYCLHEMARFMASLQFIDCTNAFQWRAGVAVCRHRLQAESAPPLTSQLDISGCSAKGSEQHSRVLPRWLAALAASGGCFYCMHSACRNVNMTRDDRSVHVPQARRRRSSFLGSWDPMPHLRLAEHSTLLLQCTMSEKCFDRS